MEPAIKDLGKVMMTMEGDYDPQKEYEILSVVSFNNISYISKKNVPVNIPVTNEEYWQLYSKNGNTPLLRKNNVNKYIEVSYDNGEHWQQLIALSDITGPQGESGGILIPDNEDIIANENKLKFANRTSDNGIGYIIVRKNVNLFLQLIQTNTIYEIRYNFDLNGEILNIPTDSVLKFVGGKISNGTIVGNNTKIDSNLVKIFDTNITITGNFIIDKVYPEWFGAESLYYNSSNEALNPTALVLPQEVDNLNDSSFAFNKAFDLAKLSSGVVYCQRRIYKIQNTINIPDKATLETQEETIFDVRLGGSGAWKVTQNEETGVFTPSLTNNAISLGVNELFTTDSMAVAFCISSIKTKIIGRGIISMINSHHTIGVLVLGTGYQKLDMSYESPYIDIRTVGGQYATIAPDIRDLYGDGAPSADLGENGQYYWDKQNKEYYHKSNNSWSIAYQGNSYSKGNLFNVSLRVDIGDGWSGGRIIRPKIRLWDMYGWRGIEIYTYGNGWLNDGYWEGSISNKHGNFVSIFATNSVAVHDFGQVTEQLDAYIQNDCCGFYAIKCNSIVCPRTWDLKWIQPTRANGRFIYLGLHTFSCRANVENANYNYVNLGRDNISNNENNSIISKEAQLIAGYINLTKYRSPKYAGLLNVNAIGSNLNGYKLTTLHSTVEDSYNDVDEPWSVPKIFFDDSPETGEFVIDSENSLYGVHFLIGTNDTNYSREHTFVEIEYETSGNFSYGDILICLCKGGNNGQGGSSKGEYNSVRALQSSNRGPTKFMFQVHGYASFADNIGIFAVKELTNVTVKVYNVRVFGVHFDNKGYSTSWSHIRNQINGPTAYIPDCAPAGVSYFDTDKKNWFLNIGSVDSPNWQPIRVEGEQTAILYNANPGQPMTWKGKDGTTKSSIEEFIETADVAPLTYQLFQWNPTIKKIKKYPPVPVSDLFNLFSQMSNLEYAPYIDMSEVEQCQYMFYNDGKLKEISNYDMSNVKNVSNIFGNCYNLETIPELNWSSATDVQGAFDWCVNLKNVGGFVGLKESIDLRHSPLTKESVLNIFNKVADVTQNPKVIILKTDVYNQLSAQDISIATNKGWDVEDTQGYQDILRMYPQISNENLVFRGKLNNTVPGSGLSVASSIPNTTKVAVYVEFETGDYAGVSSGQLNVFLTDIFGLRVPNNSAALGITGAAVLAQNGRNKHFKCLWENWIEDNVNKSKISDNGNVVYNGNTAGASFYNLPSSVSIPDDTQTPLSPCDIIKIAVFSL